MCACLARYVHRALCAADGDAVSPCRETSCGVVRSRAARRTSGHRADRTLLLLPLTPQAGYQLPEQHIQFPKIDPDATLLGGPAAAQPTPDVARGTSEAHYNQPTDLVISSCCSRLSTRPLASSLPGSPPGRRFSSRRWSATLLGSLLLLPCEPYACPVDFPVYGEFPSP